MATKVSVVLPIVHMNGTSKEDLIKQRANLLDALVNAGDALSKAVPNARDHYLKGPEYYEAANQQHDRRIGILKSLITEVEEELRFLELGDC